MSRLLRRPYGAGIAASAAALCFGANRQPRSAGAHRPVVSSAAARTGDPHLWLEEIEGEDALCWCREQNDRVVAAVGDPLKSDAYAKILAIQDSKDKIPYVGRIGGRTGDEAAKVYYNFWQDADHVRGMWRRTSLASFRSAQPEWEVVLDLDALNAAEGMPEGQQYVWHGSDVLDEGPGKALWDRVLVFLSPGGTDAQVVREFDLEGRAFVDGGFRTDVAAKCDVGYRTRDELLIGTDFSGDGSTLTDSGYPRVVKSWRRGTPLSEAVTVFEVERGDIAAAAYTYHERDGTPHEFLLRQKTFYSSEQW